MASKVPASLKPIAHYVKIANENSSRDPVVYYWCLFYAAQNAMQLDKSSPEALHFLTGLLSTLESIKKQLVGTEAITNEVVAQAHLENYALKLFNFADAKEKTGEVDKSVVHAFYTAGHVMDVLSLFGEVDSPANVGPVDPVEHHYSDPRSLSSTVGFKDPAVPYGNHSHSLPSSRSQPQVPTSSYGFAGIPVTAESNTYPSSPVHPHSKSSSSNLVSTNTFSPEVNGLNIDSSKNYERKPSAEAFNDARKFTKYALSAIDYEDTGAVVDNLRKALALMERF